MKREPKPIETNAWIFYHIGESDWTGIVFSYELALHVAQERRYGYVRCGIATSASDKVKPYGPKVSFNSPGDVPKAMRIIK